MLSLILPLAQRVSACWATHPLFIVVLNVVGFFPGALENYDKGKQRRSFQEEEFSH